MNIPRCYGAQSGNGGNIAIYKGFVIALASELSTLSCKICVLDYMRRTKTTANFITNLGLLKKSTERI